jgi:hypothetical protein
MNDAIKNELISRQIAWTGSNGFEFYQGLMTNPDKPRFGIIRDDQGYFRVGDNLSYYCNINNGMIYRIRKFWSKKDWLCYTKFYQIGLEKGFRLDIPLEMEQVDVLGEIWEYAELQSPKNRYGQNFNDDVFTWPELTNGVISNTDISDEFKNSVKQYYFEFVDQTEILIEEAKKIAIDEMVGIPKGLGSIFNRYRDDQGYFRSDFDQYQWIETIPVAVAEYLEKFIEAVYFGKFCGVIDQGHIDEIIGYAYQKWTQI